MNVMPVHLNIIKDILISIAKFYYIFCSYFQLQI